MYARDCQLINNDSELLTHGHSQPLIRFQYTFHILSLCAGFGPIDFHTLVNLHNSVLIRQTRQTLWSKKSLSLLASLKFALGSIPTTS